MQKYGFIGLGDQGAPIARRMTDAGLPVVLWARRPASLEPFAGTPAERADSIKGLAPAGGLRWHLRGRRQWGAHGS